MLESSQKKAHKKNLLFLQLSVSTYIKHKGKVWHLLHTYGNYEEFKKETVLNYYKSLCAATNVLYEFISPKKFYNNIFETTCKRETNAYTAWTIIIRYSK